METVQPLRVSVELLANLIYLAGRTETHSAQQRRYLDRAGHRYRGTAAPSEAARVRRIFLYSCLIP
jgi:hypothetical protein